MVITKSDQSLSPIWQWSSLRTHQRKIQLWRGIKSDAWKRLRVLWPLKLRICGVRTSGSDTWVTAQPLQNDSPHPLPLALSGDLSYPKPHSWVRSGIKPWIYFFKLLLCGTWHYLQKHRVGWSLSTLFNFHVSENSKRIKKKIHLAFNVMDFVPNWNLE